MTGSLEGIGAVLREREHYTEIVELVPGGASARQGLLAPGDLILSVAQASENGEPVDIADMRLDDVVKMIRGPKGTVVRLRVQKPTGTQETIDKAIDGLKIDDMSKALEDVTGLSLDSLLGLFSGEGMLYLREGTPIPEVTLVLAPKDVDKAFTDVDGLVRNLAKGMDAEITEADQDGVTVFRVDAGTVNLQYARVDDAVIVTTGASGIRLYRGDGDKLADAEAFTRAAERVSLGDRTSGFVYVDVDGLVPLVEGLADTADQTLPDDVRKAIEAFDSVILTGTSAEGGSTTMSGFVAMNPS